MKFKYLVHIHRVVDVESTVAVTANNPQEAGEMALKVKLQDANCTYEYDVHMMNVDVQPAEISDYRKVMNYARRRKEFRIKHDIHGDINL